MKNRITAFVLAGLLSFGSVSAFAEENVMSEEVKDAVVAVRSVISIDDEFDDFSYETQDENGVKLFMLRWENEDGESVCAWVKSDGEITAYNNYAEKYSDNEESYGLSFITKQQAQESAESFIKKAAPERASLVKLRSCEKWGDIINLVYSQDINSIPVSCDDIRVEVSSKSGNVLGFSDNSYLWRDKINTKADGIIDEERAKEAFLDNNGVEYTYICDFDYKSKKAELYPAYRIKNMTIDARSAKPLPDNYYLAKEALSSSAGRITFDATAEEEDFGYELSDSELAEVDKTKNYITREDAAKILVKKNLIDGGSDIKSARLTYSSYGSDCLWVLSSNDFRAAVNAVSGNVESFYLYDEAVYYDSDAEEVKKGDNEKKLTSIQAKDKINGWLKLLASDYLNEINYSEPEYDKYSNAYTVNYVREVNGVKTDSNYINIRIDAASGKLIEYDRVWYSDISVKHKEIRLSPDEAFDIYRDKTGFGLYYDAVAVNNGGDIKTDVVYEPNNYSGKFFNFYIDPESGKRLDYNGRVMEEENDDGYTDIEGCEYEEEINALYDNGYRLEGSEFKPDEPMSAETLLKLYNLEYTGEKYLEKCALEKEDILTKITAAKLMTVIIGQNQAAEKGGIFADLYSDVSAQNRGYANIVSALGIIESEDEDTFGSDITVTNAMGAHYIYNNESR